MKNKPRRPGALRALTEEIESCDACPRLVQWRESVARTKRASYANEVYWGKPVSGFGDPAADLMVVGLAPAAHGANRTGRMFTGDRSGEWLYRALHRAGFATSPVSQNRSDGLRLIDCYITAIVKCAPPENKPTPIERDTCLRYFERELELISPQVIVALGAFAWSAILRAAISAGWSPSRSPRPKFSHGAEATLMIKDRQIVLIGSFHPSQQNTFTKKLTMEMFDAIFESARRRLGEAHQEYE